ncbi:hypothetical protein RMATCC62417_13262 [Rhizopus microsporus]|nr:hypothetical protein RMATCC62417_13262 [Rhizopus microsporus]
MTLNFWTHLYRKVADDKDKRNERIKFSKDINDCFEAFDSTRSSPETREYLYSILVLDRLHVAVSNIYTSSIIQNISLHLTQNVNLYIFRVLWWSLRGLRESTNQSFNPRTIATKAAKSTELYKEYKDTNIELEGFETQYEYVIKKASKCELLIISSSKTLGIYKDVLKNDAFESISDYAYAKNNSAKLVRFSAELLKATSKPKLKIKTWHVMLRPSNNMLAVIQHIPALMGSTSFEDHYGDAVWKNNLWETLFNLDHIQKKRSNTSQASQPYPRLDYGWKTDGHMVAILFIKKFIEQIPQDDNEMPFMERGVNLSN